MEDNSDAYIILPLGDNGTFQFFSNIIALNDTTQLKEHISEDFSFAHNAEGTIFITDIESFATSSKENLQLDTQHTTNVLQKEQSENHSQLKCQQCDIEFQNLKTYTDHSKTHKETKYSFKCSTCGDIFNKSIVYKNHLLTHQEKLYNCVICQIGFNFENNYKVHMALHEKSSVCPICDVKFQRMASLKSHLAIHQVEEYHTCSECFSEFETMVQLLKHMKSHNEENENTQKEMMCGYCKVKFENHYELKKHISSHIKVKKLVPDKKRTKRNSGLGGDHKHKCSACSKTFPKLSLLERHLRIHSGERPFKCRLCDKGFTQKVTLQQHIAKHSGTKPFSCTLCPAKFTQKCNLKAHVQKTHTATSEHEKIFKCSECDCIFKRVASLNAHMSKLHAVYSDEVTITSVINQLKNLDEQLSGKLSTSKKKDKKHSDINLGPTKKEERLPSVEEKGLGTQQVYQLKQKFVGTTKIYFCSFCGKESKKPSDLIRHLRIHTKEKPFKCYCGNSFSLKSTLMAHLEVHKEKVPKNSTRNKKTSISSKILNIHKRGQETSEKSLIGKDIEKVVIKSFECHLCSATFKKKVNMKRHIQLHNRESFQCQMCERIFTTSVALRNHMKHHDVSQDMVNNVDEINLATDEKRRQQPIEVHPKGKPFECPCCHKRFKNMIACRKHIDVHLVNNEKHVLNEDTLNYADSYHIEKSTENVEYDVVHSKEFDIILHKNDQKTQTKELSNIRDAESGQLMDTNITQIIKMVDNSNLQTILLNYPNEGFSNTNHFFSQLNLQPNGAVLTSLEKSQIILNIEAVDNDKQENLRVSDVENQEETLPDIHIDTMLNNISGEKTTQNIFPDIENEDNICLDADIANSFLSSSSLYPNTQISFENPIPNTSEKNVLPEENIMDSHDLFSSDQNQADIIANINFLACCLCKKLFNDMAEVESHDCVPKNDGDTPQLLSQVEEDSNIDNVGVASKQIEEGGVLQSDSYMATKISSETSPSRANFKKIRRKVFSCVHCSKELNCRAAYTKHLNLHQMDSGDKLHQCKFCEKKFKKPSDLGRHLRTHTGEKPYACELCDKKFSLKSTLESHLRTHDPSSTKNFVCEVCNSSFSSKASRKQHMLVHSGLKPHKCTHCEQSFRTSAHKRSHEKKIHLHGGKRINQSKEKKVRNLLANAVDLATKTSEISKIIENDPALAEIQLEFSDQSDPTLTLESIQIDPALLQQIQNPGILLEDLDAEVLHSSVIQLNEDAINNLDKTSEAASTILNDMDELDVNYECDICHKKYTSSDVLMKHIQLHSKNKIACEHCGEWFRSVETLLEHEKLHLDYGSLACFLCSNSFAELQELKIHLKRMHQISDINSPLIFRMSMGETLD